MPAMITPGAITCKLHFGGNWGDFDDFLGRLTCEFSGGAKAQLLRSRWNDWLGRLFIADIPKIGLVFKNLSNDGKNRIAGRCLVLPRKFVPHRAVLLNHNAPLSLIGVRSRFVCRAAYSDEIGGISERRFDVPAPVFLAWLDRGDAFLHQLGAEPRS